MSLFLTSHYLWSSDSDYDNSFNEPDKPARCCGCKISLTIAKILNVTFTGFGTVGSLAALSWISRVHPLSNTVLIPALIAIAIAGGTSYCIVDGCCISRNAEEHDALSDP